jgi:asparagine synthase (glutamine-hydrolysing)
MCGIFALINPKGKKVPLDQCRSATALLAHRGPDAHGEWVNGDQDVFLGHRRLSILDLSSRADQPMIGSNAALIYNGEIYNFRALRSELEQHGIRFRSEGDSEVLLYALMVWGIDCLRRLEGMFAFLQWKEDTQEVLLARDFFGIKPLYLCGLPNGSMAVASEMKAFHALHDFTPEIDGDKLPEFLRFRSLAGSSTLLRGVRQVQPGECITIARAEGTTRSRRYFLPLEAIQERDGPLHCTADSFLSVFSPVVDSHLIADVAVGTQFSGGVDSTLVSAVATRESRADLSAFYCNVEDSLFDETPYARRLAAHLNIPLHEISLGPTLFFSDMLDKLSWHYDEPIAHPNSIGIYMVSRCAKGRVKVLLSGESADEFFGGYLWYRFVHAYSALRCLPISLVRDGRLLNISQRGARLLKRQIQKSRKETIDEFIVNATEFLSASEVGALLGDPRAGINSVSPRLQFLPSAQSMDSVTRCQLYDVATYLPALFTRQDKMSMAASIENRVPFCTPRIFSYAMGLSAAQRAGMIHQKAILKKALCSFVPKPLVFRKKWGFALPLGRWFQSETGMQRLNSLGDQSSSLTSYLDGDVVHKYVRAFDGSQESSEVLWVLLALQSWIDNFISGGRNQHMSGPAHEHS